MIAKDFKNADLLKWVNWSVVIWKKRLTKEKRKNNPKPNVNFSGPLHILAIQMPIAPLNFTFYYTIIIRSNVQGVREFSGRACFSSSEKPENDRFVFVKIQWSRNSLGYESARAHVTTEPRIRCTDGRISHKIGFSANIGSVFSLLLEYWPGLRCLAPNEAPFFLAPRPGADSLGRRSRRRPPKPLCGVLYFLLFVLRYYSLEDYIWWQRNCLEVRNLITFTLYDVW